MTPLFQHDVTTVTPPLLICILTYLYVITAARFLTGSYYIGFSCFWWTLSAVLFNPHYLKM